MMAAPFLPHVTGSIWIGIQSRNDMPRTARVIVPGAPHHIAQRGIRRLNVFLDSDDRAVYLEFFTKSARRFSLHVIAYSLMTNHVHYVAIPERADSLYRTFQLARGLYAQQFNMKYGLVGHLWQDRPFSCVLDDSHLWNAIRYVEQNPVRAKIVTHAADYPWSSAAAHCGLRADPLLEPFPEGIAVPLDWRTWLEGETDDNHVDFLRACTKTGRPCGEDEFVATVGQMTHRAFNRKKPGPKPKFPGGSAPSLEFPEFVPPSLEFPTSSSVDE